MATQAWEIMKQWIKDVDDPTAAILAAHLGVDDPERYKIYTAAYQECRKRAGGEYRGPAMVAHYQKMYDELRGVVGRETVTLPQETTPEYPDPEIVSPPRATSPTIATQTPPATPAPSGIMGAVTALAAELERMASVKPLDPEQVRSIVAEMMAGRAPMVFQVQRGEEVVGRVEGRQHGTFATLLRWACIRNDDGFHPNILLHGPKGSGKSRAGKELARAMGLHFRYHGAALMSPELIGYMFAEKYIQTEFYLGYTSPSVVLLDELDAYENQPMLALAGALANGLASFPCGMTERHPDSVIIGAANTIRGANAEYTGRNKLDEAILSRFPVKIFWDYDYSLERDLYGDRPFQIMQEAREAARRAGLKLTFDPRQTAVISAALRAGISEEECRNMTYRAEVTPDQRKLLP